MSAAALVVVLFVLAALSQSRYLRRVNATLGIAHLTATGHLYLVVGYLLGLTVEAGDLARLSPGLTPVITFVAGWIGFSVGLAFRARVLRPVPARAFAVALAPALAAATVVSILAWLVLRALGVAWPESMAAALVLGGAAAATSPTLAAALRRGPAGRARNIAPMLRLLHFTGGVTNIVTLAFAAAGFAVFAYGFGELPPLLWLGTTVAVGVVTGVVTWLFLGGSSTDDERLLLGIAMIAFGAGIGTWLRLSPAVIGAIAGAVLVNLPGDTSELFRRTLQRVERPAVVILMTVIGVYIAGIASWLVLALLGLMTVARALVLIAVARPAGRLIPAKSTPAKSTPAKSTPAKSIPAKSIPARSPDMASRGGWAYGLIPQGVFGLVIALGFMRAWESPHALEVLAAVALASMVNELVSAPAMRGALGPGTPQGSEEAP